MFIHQLVFVISQEQFLQLGHITYNLLNVICTKMLILIMYLLFPRYAQLST